MGSKKKGAKSYPGEPYIELTMSRQPEHNNFVRFLSFRNHFGKRKRLAVAFRKKSGLTWKSQEFPEGIDVIRSFVDTGNRNYWDAMYLENRGGSTELPINHIIIEMNYENPSGLTPTGIDHSCIPIVDMDLNLTLRAGRHCSSLNRYSRLSRYQWAGISSSAPRLVRSVAEDLGKSGSDGTKQDKYGSNPKYGGDISLLCSEFASWYYYNCGVKIAGQDFRDITGTQQMHNIFRDAKRLYYYKNSDNTWCNVDTGNSYSPKAGDYLERRGPGGAEHSMIMLRWDGSSKEAVVFNGPWPVTLRRVRIDHDEKNNDKVFYIGRVSF